MNREVDRIGLRGHFELDIALLRQWRNYLGAPMRKLTADDVRYLARVTPSRMFLGHESGVRATLRDTRQLARIRRNAPTYEHADIALGQSLRAHGFAITGPVAPGDATAMVRAATWLCDDPSASVPMGGRIPEAVRYVIDPLSRIPQLRDLLTPGAMNVVRASFGSEFRIESVRFWRIASLPEAERCFHHYGNLWHVDGHSPAMLKLYVQIDDATGDGSAMRLISKKATARIMRTGYRGSENIRPGVERRVARETVCFDQPPGSMLFADTNRCLHRAGIPLPGETRAMVQFWFTPADRPPRNGDYFAEVPRDAGVGPGRVA